MGEVRGNTIMCLAIPTKIKSIDGIAAEVDLGGVSRNISIIMTPEAQVGDYVLVHTGYSINVIDEDEALETLKLLEELGEAV